MGAGGTGVGEGLRNLEKNDAQVVRIAHLEVWVPMQVKTVTFVSPRGL